MPEKVGAEGKRSDRRSDTGECPDLARMRDSQTADIRRALNPGARDVESPGENKGEGETDRHQHNEHLLDPRWRVKDRQDRAADLDESGSDYAVSERDAIDASLL